MRKFTRNSNCGDKDIIEIHNNKIIQYGIRYGQETQKTTKDISSNDKINFERLKEIGYIEG